MKIKRGAQIRLLAKGTKLEFTQREIELAAQIILDCVKEEIKKDIAKSSGLRGEGRPVPIPDSQRFIDSFKYRITGKMIDIYSDWPTADAHLNKKDKGPFEMTWLSKPQTQYARIETGGGGISLVRSTPNGPDFWVHPGFKKYNFLDRGVRKGRLKAIEQLAAGAITRALRGN